MSWSLILATSLPRSFPFQMKQTKHPQITAFYLLRSAKHGWCSGKPARQQHQPKHPFILSKIKNKNKKREATGAAPIHSATLTGAKHPSHVEDCCRRPHQKLEALLDVLLLDPFFGLAFHSIAAPIETDKTSSSLPLAHCCRP